VFQTIVAQVTAKINNASRINSRIYCPVPSLCCINLASTRITIHKHPSPPTFQSFGIPETGQPLSRETVSADLVHLKEI
jgi:hypothetical protein